MARPAPPRGGATFANRSAEGLKNPVAINLRASNEGRDRGAVTGARPGRPAPARNRSTAAAGEFEPTESSANVRGARTPPWVLTGVDLGFRPRAALVAARPPPGSPRPRGPAPPRQGKRPTWSRRFTAADFHRVAELRHRVDLRSQPFPAPLQNTARATPSARAPPSGPRPGKHPISLHHPPWTALPAGEPAPLGRWTWAPLREPPPPPPRPYGRKPPHPPGTPPAGHPPEPPPHRQRARAVGWTWAPGRKPAHPAPPRAPHAVHLHPAPTLRHHLPPSAFGHPLPVGSSAAAPPPHGSPRPHRHPPPRPPRADPASRPPADPARV